MVKKIIIVLVVVIIIYASYLMYTTYFSGSKDDLEKLKKQVDKLGSGGLSQTNDNIADLQVILDGQRDIVSTNPTAEDIDAMVLIEKNLLILQIQSRVGIQIPPELKVVLLTLSVSQLTDVSSRPREEIIAMYESLF